MNLNTINTNNKNFWDETKEFVILNNRFPLNPPEQCPGFYADLTDKVVERLKHSQNLFSDLGRIKFDLANTSLPLDNTYVTALQQWHIELTATGVLVFEAQDVMGEYVKQFKTQRRSWINTLKQTVKDYAKKNGLKWQFVWHIFDQLELFPLDRLRDEVYAPHYSSAAPWHQKHWHEHWKALAPKGAGELLVPVADSPKERRRFGQKMTAINRMIENSRNLLPKVNMKAADRDYVVYRDKLYDKPTFESMCEYAGNNYYVLYDGMETVLFKLEKIYSFTLNESQRSSLAQVGICIAEDGSFVDTSGNTCNIYLPYIFASRYGSYQEASSSSTLSRFRVWQKNGLELEPLRTFVHKFWNYPTDGVYAFDSIDEFLCYYVGEAPGGNYGERVAGYTTTNEDPQVPYYLPNDELTLDTATAKYVGSISVPDGEYPYKSIWSMRSGETFMIINRNGEQFVYPLSGESYRKFVRECFYYEEEYCPWEFRENTPYYYKYCTIEIGHCCYKSSLHDMWCDFLPYEIQTSEKGLFETETLYREYTGKFFLHGEGFMRDEFYTIEDLNTPCVQAADIPLTDSEAAMWMKEHCEAGTVERIFGGIDPSARN